MHFNLTQSGLCAVAEMSVTQSTSCRTACIFGHISAAASKLNRSVAVNLKPSLKVMCSLACYRVALVTVFDVASSVINVYMNRLGVCFTSSLSAKLIMG
jgi:hypothetical protein